MEKIFVDTNYFLRHILADNKTQQRKTKKLLEDGAEGKVGLFTSTLVIFEIYWVLASFYKYRKPHIIKALKGVLLLNFVALKERKRLLFSLNLFEAANIDFEDCYNFIYAIDEEATDFATFDKRLKNQFSKFA